MNIFVTGGSGFIGSNFIINQIDIHNNNILNYDKLTYAANPENLSKHKSNRLYNFIQGDLLDSQKLSASIKNFKPDYIINFAAESHVDRSIDGPKELINTNIANSKGLINCFKIINNIRINRLKN